MKICPVCNAKTFDDMRICFGCLHHLGDKKDLSTAIPVSDNQATSQNTQACINSLTQAEELVPVWVYPEDEASEIEVLNNEDISMEVFDTNSGRTNTRKSLNSDMREHGVESTVGMEVFQERAEDYSKTVTFNDAGKQEINIDMKDFCIEICVRKI
ncbi:MAG: hypothetical protein IJV62_04040 [Eggerthellaceae bacterium]|nr:hypothetical protein [Eggerthellaceae bacterium]